MEGDFFVIWVNITIKCNQEIGFDIEDPRVEMGSLGL